MATKRQVSLANPKQKSASYWTRYRKLMPKYYWDDSTRLTNIFISKAKGSILTDVDGSDYIDLTSQWATNNLGHVHPEVLDATVKALEQYGFLIYGMNPHVPMIDLAEKLVEIAPSSNLTRVFLELSGTGAAEGAVKFAIESSKRPLILSFLGQYHGLSIGGINIGSLTSEERRYWEAFQGGVIHAPYPFPYRRPRGMTENDYGDWVLSYIEDQLLKHIASPERIAGVLFEPVACEAGIWIPPSDFLRGLRRLCESHDWFFIDDEVEAGLGRTGKMWAIENWGVSPDLVAIGKAISGGLMPIAAVLGSERAMGEQEASVGTTFAGHPAACAAAVATLNIMQRERIPERSALLGVHALKRVREWESFDLVGETRGLGLCIGIELVKDKESKVANPEAAKNVFHDCVENGTILLYSHDDHVLRIEPPLTIEEKLLDSALDTTERALRKYAKRKG